MRTLPKENVKGYIGATLLIGCIVLAFAIPGCAKGQAQTPATDPIQYVIDTDGDKVPDWAGTSAVHHELGYDDKPVIAVITGTETDSINFVYRGHRYALLPTKPKGDDKRK